MFFFFFQAEDGIRDVAVTGVQTCALPISATIPDRMHHLDLGLFNYQVTYTRELLKEWCGQIAVDELDNRLARIPRFPGLKIFKNGLENIKRFTADEFRNMMKVFIFVIEGIIKKTS